MTIPRRGQTLPRHPRDSPLNPRCMGTLYYGDNLDILTRTIADESVDLVYLDPPFNSAQNYNAFFPEKDGTAEEAEGNREAWWAGEQQPRKSMPSRTHGSGTTTAAPPTTHSPCAPTSSAASCAPSWNSSGQTT